MVFGLELDFDVVEGLSDGNGGPAGDVAGGELEEKILY